MADTNGGLAGGRLARMAQLRIDKTDPRGKALVEALHFQLRKRYGTGGGMVDNTAADPPIYSVLGPADGDELRAVLDATGIVWAELATVIDRE